MINRLSEHRRSPRPSAVTGRAGRQGRRETLSGDAQGHPRTADHPLHGFRKPHGISGFAAIAVRNIALVITLPWKAAWTTNARNLMRGVIVGLTAKCFG
jgi:hypothetical protein